MNLAMTGAVLMALSVGLGAFGAHGLKAHVAADALGWWETGVTYQAWHGIGLLALAALKTDRNAPWLERGGLSICVGVLIFSGSLFVMTVTGIRALGAITPIGGLLLILGWIFVAVGVRKQETTTPHL